MSAVYGEIMMKVGKKWFVALVLLLITSGSALALGLGQIKVKSTLNEPLLAEIPIVSASPDELKNLTVSLASSAAFQRAGIDRARLAANLTFKVEKRASGSVIVVTSEDPIGDPVLDLLLELDWSNGKLLREYSVLLDPPGMPATPVASPQTAVAAAPAATTPAAQAPAAHTTGAPSAAPATQRAADTASAPTNHASSLDAGESYTAAAGDSVWSVAARSTSAGNINRMMLAIQRLNPDAFYRDNINALQKGAVLRIPNRDEMQSISAEAARGEVRRQNQVWSNPQAGAPSVLANAGGSAATSTANAGNASASAGSRLELVPPGGDGSAGAGRSGVAGGTGSAAIAGLQKDLARTKESLASEKQQTEELQSRITALEGMRDKNQRLLDLKNAQIAELQQKLAAANEAKPAGAGSVATLREDIFAAPAEATSATAEPVAAAPSELAGAASVAVAGSAQVAEPAAAGSTAVALAPAASASAQAAEPLAATEAVVEPENAEPAVTAAAAPQAPWYMQPWAWIAAAVIVLLLLLFGLRKRRSRAADHGAELDDLPGAEGGGVDSDDEEELRAQLEENPDDLGLHLELANLYYAYREQGKFVGAAEAMYAHVDDPMQPEWQQVRAMGEELCPDHPLFASDETDLEDDDAGFDTDEVSLLGMVDGGHDVDEDKPHDDTDGGYNFDFDLTGDDDRGDDGSAAPLPPLPETDDDGFDFGDDLTHDTGLDGNDTAAGAALAERDGEVAHREATESAEFDSAALRSDDTESLTPSAGQALGPDEDDDDGAGFSSDPVDTKLDLARAYQDMGDDEGARAMLEEVLQEGTTAQQDVARKLLDELG